MAGNINLFNEKQDYLITARDDVVKRDAMAAELDKMKAYQKKLSKNIAAEEKSIADEISSTIKKRKQEISDTYDGRLDDNRARKKKVANKRDKKKSQRMNERIHNETKDIRKDNRELEIEMKTLLKKDKAPSICTSGIYYIMFMPRGGAEILGAIVSFILYFAGIPAGIMLLIKKLVIDTKHVNTAFWCVLILAVVIIAQIVIYFIMYISTKNKHQEALSEARNIRDRIKANKKQMNAISNSINKDKDESAYKLDAYDEKLANLDEEADNIGNEKQKALKQFESETKQLIIDEINGRRLQTLEDMKAEKSSLDEKITKGESKYSEKLLQIANQYAAFIGEEFCKEDKLADLITLMDEGQAANVSEAISLYKGQKSSK